MDKLAMQREVEKMQLALNIKKLELRLMEIREEEERIKQSIKEQKERLENLEDD